jgi:hypothetical protein
VLQHHQILPTSCILVLPSSVHTQNEIQLSVIVFTTKLDSVFSKKDRIHRKADSGIQKSSISPIRFLLRMEKIRLMCKACPCQILVPSGSGRAIHTNNLLSTGSFHGPLQVVGNWGHFRSLGACFSKFQELHCPVLENSPTNQLVLYKQLHPNFHFSWVNYGYYYRFYKSFHTPSTPVAPQTASASLRRLAS